MNQPAFRPARESDLPFLLTLVEEFHTEDGHAFETPVITAAVRGLLAQPQRGAVWLVLDGATPVGYYVVGFGYSLEFQGVDAFVDELYLRLAWRGRGWGKAALAHAEEFARTHGVRALHLEVTRGNAHARAVYTHLGYRDHDRYLMTKWLA